MVVLDSLEYGHRRAVIDAPLEVGDIADAELVRRVVEEHGVDSVVHFAAYKAAGESMEVPERYFENNVGRSARLLAAIHEAGVERFVFSSTCAVYGTPRTLPVDEEHPTGPESPYGESKRIVEQMLHWFDECHGLRSVALRYFNAAGASTDARIGEDNPRPLNLVPLAMQAALSQIPLLTVNGTDYPTPDGSTIRDYIHVDDLADAHVRALGYLEQGGASTVVNVGTGRGASTIEVIDGAKRVSGVDFATKSGPRRPGDPSRGLRRQPARTRGARLGAEVRPRRHPRERVEVALHPPRRIRPGRVNGVRRGRLLAPSAAPATGERTEPVARDPRRHHRADPER